MYSFDRKEFLADKENEKRSAELKREEERQRMELEELNRNILDWEAMAEALKRWDGQRPGPSIYLPGSDDYILLANHLRERELSDGTIRTMSKEENLDLFKKWIEAGKKSTSVRDFISRCDKDGVGVPPELEN